MLRFHLDKKKAENWLDCYHVLHDLHKLSVPRPYETTVWVRSNLHVIISTTSKNLHLSMGRLGDGWQIAFCCVIEATYYKEGKGKAVKDAELCFTYEPLDGQPMPKAIFIVRSEGEDIYGKYIRYTISPGH